MVGIDLAWSGDAVYAMNGADDLRETDPSKPTLYYVCLKAVITFG